MLRRDFFKGSLGTALGLGLATVTKSVLADTAAPVAATEFDGIITDFTVSEKVFDSSNIVATNHLPGTSNSGYYCTISGYSNYINSGAPCLISGSNNDSTARSIYEQSEQGDYLYDAHGMYSEVGYDYDTSKLEAHADTMAKDRAKRMEHAVFVAMRNTTTSTTGREYVYSA